MSDISTRAGIGARPTDAAARRVIPIVAQAAIPAPAASGASAEDEAKRQLRICNACRYCEGYCAMFQAMTRRLDFNDADTHYLANLCHNCGNCLHACQYAPPHEFGVNIPQAMARLRTVTYQRYAWPSALGTLYRRAGSTLVLGLIAASILLMALAAYIAPVAATGRGFYAVFPHGVLAAIFGVVFLYALCAMATGLRRFWREIGPARPAPASRTAWSGPAREAATDVLTMKYLGGGHGEGCNNESDAFTLWRRRFHHATFYGFMACFAATCVATLYHYLFGWHAPYPVTSLPVVLGTLGGILLCVGTPGLLWLNFRRDPQQGDPGQRPMDRGFILVLFLIAGSGLALLAWRDSAAMRALLIVHLATVMALFLTMPYGKFVHGLYRGAALLRFARERRSPPTAG